MSYTVTNDGGVIQVRATIETRTEMEALAKALSNAEKHLPAPSITESLQTGWMMYDGNNKFIGEYPTEKTSADTKAVLDEHTLTHKR